MKQLILFSELKRIKEEAEALEYLLKVKPEEKELIKKALKELKASLK